MHSPGACLIPAVCPSPTCRRTLISFRAASLSLSCRPVPASEGVFPLRSTQRRYPRAGLSRTAPPSILFPPIVVDERFLRNSCPTPRRSSGMFWLPLFFPGERRQETFSFYVISHTITRSANAAQEKDADHRHICTISSRRHHMICPPFTLLPDRPFLPTAKEGRHGACTGVSHVSVLFFCRKAAFPREREPEQLRLIEKVFFQV